MKKVMLSHLMKDSKGFTRIELLAVMAIIGVLAAILTPIASQSGEAARDAQIRQDAGTVEGAIGSFFADKQLEADILSPESVTVTTRINGSTQLLVTQNVSSRYPEKFITHQVVSGSSVYTSEFPTGGTDTNGVVVDVFVTDLDGQAISGSNLLTQYTAIDFTGLLSDGFVTEKPSSVTAVRMMCAPGARNARRVVVMKLLTVVVTEGTGKVILNYGRIH